MTDQEAEVMLDSLREHFGENVAPVSRYCEAFSDWQRALTEKLAEPDCDEQEKQQYQQVLDALNVLYIPVMKSNYLARRIYGGERHRTEKCPAHKGRWSGCHPSDTPDGSCACVTANNTTGWLPADDTENLMQAPIRFLRL